MKLKDNRGEFEAWIKNPPFEKSVERLGPDSAWPGMYKEVDVHLAWNAWCAANDVSHAVVEGLLSQFGNSLVRHGIMVSARAISERK